MDSKSLLIGITSFLAGGLLVSIAATTFEKDKDESDNMGSMSMSESMDHSVGSLEGKEGDEFDKAFLSEMIVHHEGAVDMAKLAQNQAKHDEIKQLANNIISAQKKEISEMRQWQADWCY